MYLCRVLIIQLRLKTLKAMETTVQERAEKMLINIDSHKNREIRMINLAYDMKARNFIVKHGLVRVTVRNGEKIITRDCFGTNTKTPYNF